MGGGFGKRFRLRRSEEMETGEMVETGIRGLWIESNNGDGVGVTRNSCMGLKMRLGKETG